MVAAVVAAAAFFCSSPGGLPAALLVELLSGDVPVDDKTIGASNASEEQRTRTGVRKREGGKGTEGNRRGREREGKRRDGKGREEKSHLKAKSFPKQEIEKKV